MYNVLSGKIFYTYTAEMLLIALFRLHFEKQEVSLSGLSRNKRCPSKVESTRNQELSPTDKEPVHANILEEELPLMLYISSTTNFMSGPRVKASGSLSLWAMARSQLGLWKEIFVNTVHIFYQINTHVGSSYSSLSCWDFPMYVFFPSRV